MGSTQWLEKSSGSSDKVLWAQTKGVNHTVHTKIGISNLEQETATWLRVLSLLYAQNVRTQADLSTYVSDDFQL